jgi:hypothetical protein
VQCDAQCKGSCTGTATAPHCEGNITPPKCEVKGDCKANCNASVSAKAECTPPALRVKASAQVAANLQAQFDAAVRSLEANLPRLLVVFRARGEAFIGSVKAVGESGARVVANTGHLEAKGIACAGAMVQAATAAVGNAQASVEASGNVMGSVGVK